MKEIVRLLWNIIGNIVTIFLVIRIAFDYIMLDKQPSHMMIFITLLLYMQLYLKHENK